MSKRVVSRKRAGRKSLAADLPFTFETVQAMMSPDTTAEFYNTYRQQAWEVYDQTPMPTLQDEAWRRTDLRRLETDSFRISSPGASGDMPPVPKALLQPLVSDRHGGQLILQPGGLATVDLDEQLASQGVIFSDLRTAATSHPQVVADILGKVVGPENGKFAALSAALAQNGVFVYIPRGVQVEAPLHSVLWGPGVRLAHFSHVLVWVDEGASVTYVHEAASSPVDEEGQSLHGGLVEVLVGAGANLRFVELQSWGKHVWNFTHERARLDRDASLDWIYGGLGTYLTKSFLDLDLQGQGANARMSGFFFTDGRQHIDLDTQQNHFAPNTTSDLLYKGALKDRSRAVWQGMIYVAPGAQNTDGYQANRNLVLNREARADSIPGLEIQADDVRCTHGATVGKIDPDLLFYLHSRGILTKTARRLIVEGFFEPVMQRIPFAGVRERFQEAIVAKMGREKED